MPVKNKHWEKFIFININIRNDLMGLWTSTITRQNTRKALEKNTSYTYFKDWTEYKKGFGNTSGEQWLVKHYTGRAKRVWYLSLMRAAKVQASLRIRAVSPEPSLLAHTSSESRGTFRQKARSLANLNDWACAVKICHDGMLEDTNSLDAAHT